MPPGSSGSIPGCSHQVEDWSNGRMDKLSKPLDWSLSNVNSYIFTSLCDEIDSFQARSAYRFDDVVSAIGQTSDVDLGLQFAINWSKETVRAVDAHYSFLADLHADAALQFIHRDLHVTYSTAIISHLTEAKHSLIQSQWRITTTTEPTSNQINLYKLAVVDRVDVLDLLDYSSFLPHATVHH